MGGMLALLLEERSDNSFNSSRQHEGCDQVNRKLRVDETLMCFYEHVRGKHDLVVLLHETMPNV